MPRCSALLTGLTLLFLCSAAAVADTIYTYTYTGNPLSTPIPSSGYQAPFNSSDIVTASFTTSSPLGSNIAFSPLTFDSLTMSSGPFTLTEATAVDPRICLSTNASGAISTWYIGENFDPIDGIVTINTTSGEKCGGTSFGSTFGTDEIGVDYPSTIGAFNSDDPGTWNLTVTTTAAPEPSTLVLLGSGLVSIVGFARRKLIR
jgi:PEP-CTERM motif